MRKVSITASQDGGDSTSITSGMENEMKRPGAGIMRSKKTSIKRKVQISLESDDGVIEPLLQKDKEKIESINQSAKLLLSKTKTESTTEKGDDKDKLLDDNKGVSSITIVPGVTDNQLLPKGIKDSHTSNSYASAAPIHNHMNTNVFAAIDNKIVSTPKSQILVEIDESKQNGSSPSPLIFTTAKIHTDTKPLEPLQVTPVPILSTVEGDALKTSTATSAKDENTVVPLSKSDNIKNNVKTTPSSFISNANHSSVIIFMRDATAPSKVSLNTSNNVTTTSQSLPSKSISQPYSSVSTGIKENDVKNKISTYVSLPQTTNTTICMTAKPAASQDLKSVSSFSSTSLAKSEESKSASTATDSNIITRTREPEIDINKNIQTTSTSRFTSQIPESCTTSVYNKSNDEVCGKGTRTTSNSLSNKYLQRQKNSIDDTKVFDTATKVTASSNVNKESRSSEDKINTSKASVLTTITEPEVSKTVKTVIISPKISANNTLVSSILTPITKTTANSTIASKSQQITSVITKTSTQSSKSPYGVNPTSEPKTSSANTTGNTNTQSTVTNVKPSPSSTTTSSTKLATTKTVITTGAKSDKTPSTVINKQTTSATTAKSSTLSTLKSAPSSTTATQAAVKPSVVSTVKTVTSNSTPTSIPNKTSTVTTMKASTDKASSAAKPTQQKSASPSTGTSSTVKPIAKQSDFKRNDPKDDKSKA